MELAARPLGVQGAEAAPEGAPVADPVGAAEEEKVVVQRRRQEDPLFSEEGAADRAPAQATAEQEGLGVMAEAAEVAERRAAAPYRQAKEDPVDSEEGEEGALVRMPLVLWGDSEAVEEGVETLEAEELEDLVAEDLPAALELRPTRVEARTMVAAPEPLWGEPFS